MHAFDVLSDPVRRRILEVLAEKRIRSSGQIVEVIGQEFGISQSAVSQHLKVLRNSGFASVTAEGTKRLYMIEPSQLEEVDEWLSQFRAYWAPKFDALATEIARGKKKRKK